MAAVGKLDVRRCDRMRFNCKIEPADLRRALWVHIRPRPVFAVIGVALALLLVAVFTLALYRLLTSGEGLSLVLTLGACIAYFGWYFFVCLPRRMTRLYDQQKMLHDEFSVEISDEHLTSRNAHGESKIPWSVFHKWKSGGGMVLLYQSDALFHVFPARVFPSAADFQSFREILTRQLGPRRA